MTSAEDQQLGICLLKLNLEEIGRGLVVQHTAIPALEAQNEKKNSEALSVLNVVRSFNLKIEKVKEESVRLTAKRIQLKRQIDELSQSLEDARKKGGKLETLLKEDIAEIDGEIWRYEDSLEKKADRFRNAHVYYDKAKVSREMKNNLDVINQLQNKFEQNQGNANKWKQEAESICPEVKEDLLEICGRQDLEEKVKALKSELVKKMKKPRVNF